MPRSLCFQYYARKMVFSISQVKKIHAFFVVPWQVRKRIPPIDLAPFFPGWFPLWLHIKHRCCCCCCCQKSRQKQVVYRKASWLSDILGNKRAKGRTKNKQVTWWGEIIERRYSYNTHKACIVFIAVTSTYVHSFRARARKRIALASCPKNIAGVSFSVQCIVLLEQLY